MNIEELIHDLRARINPQYYDQIGTESYERHQVVKALEYLATENERLKVDAERANATGLEHQLRESRQNDYHAMSYLADCRFAVGDDGKRMLPEFIEYLKALKQQRDELLASLKEARELVEDWGAYAPAYMQEKHDLEGDMNKLDAAIARAEAP